MRLISVVVAAIVAAALLPAVALADGDPASDVLLGENVFYPFTPTVAPSLQAKLNAETAAAKRAHIPIKVALIGSPVDLGAIPSLFGKPQQYAEFLDQEISFGGAKQPLLVVMRAGYGVAAWIPPRPRPRPAWQSRRAATSTTWRRRRSSPCRSWRRRPGTRSPGSRADRARAGLRICCRWCCSSWPPSRRRPPSPRCGGGERAVACERDAWDTLPPWSSPPTTSREAWGRPRPR